MCQQFCLSVLRVLVGTGWAPSDFLSPDLCPALGSLSELICDGGGESAQNSRQTLCLPCDCLLPLGSVASLPGGPLSCTAFVVPQVEACSHGSPGERGDRSVPSRWTAGTDCTSLLVPPNCSQDGGLVPSVSPTGSYPTPSWNLTLSKWRFRAHSPPHPTGKAGQGIQGLTPLMAPKVAEVEYGGVSGTKENCGWGFPSPQNCGGLPSSHNSFLSSHHTTDAGPHTHSLHLPHQLLMRVLFLPLRFTDEKNGVLGR